MNLCPKCGGTDVVMLDAANDLCLECKEWFPAVADVYCHACSEAGGAEMPIYHVAPACDVAVAADGEGKGEQE